jgi:hypothetical protein
LDIVSLQPLPLYPQEERATDSNKTSMANGSMFRAWGAMSLILSLQPCSALVPAALPSLRGTVSLALSPQALQQMDSLFPPVEEFQRIQTSRKDGYWPYISKKEEPPTDFTYGEFPLPFFAELVDHATAASAKACPSGLRANAEFVDLGSGSGRLVLAAASMENPWRRVRGVEFLPSLHGLAEEKLKQAENMPGFLTAEVSLENSSWDAPDLDLTSVDVAFAYTTALSTEGGLLAGLTQALQDKLSPNSILVTTDYQMGEGFTLLSSFDGVNDKIGGVSTGYIYCKN